MGHSPIGRSQYGAMNEAAADPEYRAALERLLPYERIARLVIRVRMELGISQEELARRVRTSASAIARLEAGHHRPSVETLRRVARALDSNLVIGFQPAGHSEPEKEMDIPVDDDRYVVAT